MTDTFFEHNRVYIENHKYDPKVIQDIIKKLKKKVFDISNEYNYQNRALSIFDTTMSNGTYGITSSISDPTMSNGTYGITSSISDPTMSNGTYGITSSISDTTMISDTCNMSSLNIMYESMPLDSETKIDRIKDKDIEEYTNKNETENTKKLINHPALEIIELLSDKKVDKRVKLFTINNYTELLYLDGKLGLINDESKNIIYDEKIHVGIFGKVNSGKSTLINSIHGKKYCVTSREETEIKTVVLIETNDTSLILSEKDINNSIKEYDIANKGNTNMVTLAYHVPLTNNFGKKLNKYSYCWYDTPGNGSTNDELVFRH
jgi:hypothetical protein